MSYLVAAPESVASAATDLSKDSAAPSTLARVAVSHPGRPRGVDRRNGGSPARPAADWPPSSPSPSFPRIESYQAARSSL